MTIQEYKLRRDLLRAESLGGCLGIANGLRGNLDDPCMLRIAAEMLIEEANRYIAESEALDAVDRAERKPLELVK